MSLHSKLVPVQYREYDINLFLMIFPYMSLHCMLVPVQYRNMIMIYLYAYIEQMSQQSWMSQQSHTTLTQSTNPCLKEE